MKDTGDMVESSPLHVSLKVTGTVDVGLPDESEELLELVVENGRTPLPGNEAEDTDDALLLALDAVVVEFELNVEDEDDDDAFPLELILLDPVTVELVVDTVPVSLELLELSELLELEVRVTEMVELKLDEADLVFVEDFVIGALPDKLDNIPGVLDDEREEVLVDELDKVNRGNVTP